MFALWSKWPRQGGCELEGGWNDDAATMAAALSAWLCVPVGLGFRAEADFGIEIFNNRWRN